MKNKKALISDCIMVKDKPAKGGGSILDGFISPITATVIERLTAAGVEILPNAVDCGEFGVPRNTDTDPPEIITCIKNAAADFALVSDIFGDIATAAAVHGLVYIRPTYGTVSRYGLIPCACSCDQIGIIARTPAEGFAVLALIAGYDEKDGAMYQQANGADCTTTDIKVRAATADSLPCPTLCAAVHYIITAGELAANISRYDGVSFGYAAKGAKTTEELYFNTRSVFGSEVKLRAAIGVMSQSAGYYTRYYEKALKLRRKIKQELLINEGECILIEENIRHGYILSVLTGNPAVLFSENGKTKILLAAPRGEGLLRTAV